MNAFALTADALHGEPWRLWSGHLVHYDLEHLLINVIAAGPPLLLLRRGQWLKTILWAVMAAPPISLAVLAAVPGGEYRGASAIVVGLWILVPLTTRRSAASMVILTAAVFKVTMEMLTPVNITGVSVPPLPLAHLAGAVAGVVGSFPVVLDRLVNLRAVHQVQ